MSLTLAPMSNAWLLSAILSFGSLQKNSRNCLGVAVQNLLGKSGNPYQPVIIHSRASRHQHSNYYVILPALLPAFGTKFAVCSCPSYTVPGSLRLKVQGQSTAAPEAPARLCMDVTLAGQSPPSLHFSAGSFHFTKWNSLLVCAGCDSRQGWLNGRAKACLSHPAPGVPRLTLSRTVVLVLV